MPNGAPASHLIGRDRECEALLRRVISATAGQSQVLVVRGEAGVGKSALLNYLVEHSAGCRVVRLAGAESEMELAFAGLQQLCAPMLNRLETLPAPQREALATALGLYAGEPPNRFLVGLAVLGLLAEVAEAQPLLCVIDDAQWLDRVSAQSLVFAGRRLLAERVALVFVVREPSEQHEFDGLDELRVEPLGDADSRVLLESALLGPIDDQVRDRIVAETRGNPLALLELPHGLTPTELAGGFGSVEAIPLATVVEQSFCRRLETLPPDTRRLLLAAAADPLGDVALLWRAADELGITAEAAAPAEAEGLIDFDTRVRFRHPLVRSAIYRSASPDERRRVHRALAGATDPELDPDRRAWHRAHATPGLDEAVAAELEQCAGRAQARGGLAAAAAFLEHAAALTPDPSRRAERGLAAATSKRDAGALDTALELLRVVEAGPPDPLRTAEVEHLRGQIAFDQRRASAAPLLLSAARRMEPLSPARAREVHLESIGAAIWVTGFDGNERLRNAAEAALTAPASSDPPRAVDLLLDGFAIRFTAGYEAAAPMLTRALEATRNVTLTTENVGRWLWLVGNRAAGLLPLELWDFDAWEDLARRQMQLARDTGALVQLQFALNFLASALLAAGDASAAEVVIEEDASIAQSTGNPTIAYTTMWHAAVRGLDGEATAQIETTTRDATARGQERVVGFAEYATSVLCNGLGHYDAARDAARRAFDRDIIGLGTLVVPELAEAASRTGDTTSVATACEWLAERTRATPTEWSLGIEARVRALVETGDAAEDLYRESIERLGRTRLRLDVARTHLLYGEWLRREGRRVDAREQLRVAHDMLINMRADGFADRARRELLATGETVRKRTDDTRDDLTAQESQIALLARDGHTNPEIGSQLFISARTVEWHLRKVFTKLGINSRRELRSALVLA